MTATGKVVVGGRPPQHPGSTHCYPLTIKEAVCFITKQGNPAFRHAVNPVNCSHMKSARSTSALAVQVGGGGRWTRQTADGAGAASHTRTTSSSLPVLSHPALTSVAPLSDPCRTHRPKMSQKQVSNPNVSHISDGNVGKSVLCSVWCYV